MHFELFKERKLTGLHTVCVLMTLFLAVNLNLKIYLAKKALKFALIFYANSIKSCVSD
jgi:hypothetical protein